MLAQLILRASGLPSLQPVVVDSATEAVLHGIADRLEGGEGDALLEAPLATVDFLRWLTDRRDVLFHGSSRGDLETLEPIRLSRDTTTFGDQQAVYASNDPVWAIYFAILRRDAQFSTRNASMGVAGAGVYPRWYTFALLPPADPQARFGRGSLYVLPRAPFRPEPPQLGVLDTAQWVSPEPVHALVRIDVGPDDFPFLQSVGPYNEREPMLFTMVRAAVRNRSGRGRTGPPPAAVRRS
ncbi:MAG TPA: hypothetical protein VLB89_07665 [Gaiellaceae bacterium]|nr:hypothetical protein [Gaiellaceae bacterium]